MVTRYEYYDDSGEPLTGELESIDYNDDSVLDVTFAYNRLGGHSQVVDEAGTRTFTVNTYGQPDEESIDDSSGGLYSKVIKRRYGATAGTNLGKNTGFEIGVEGDTDADYGVTYHYTHVTGYIAMVQADGQSQVGYGRVPSTTIVSMIMGMTVPLNSNIVYAANRNVRTVVRNYKRTTPVETYGQYTYTYDALGRRTSVANTGTGFAATAFNLWGYNDRSEITDSRRYSGAYTPTPDPQTEIAAERRLYDYDPIGNP